MLSRPELSFIGPEVSAHLLGWIDGAVAAQDAVDRARRAVQARAQSAASRFAGHARMAAGRFMELGGTRPDNQHGRATADLDAVSAGIDRFDGTPDRSSGAAWRRVARWRRGRGHPNN
jgi:hypothetical protein